MRRLPRWLRCVKCPGHDAARLWCLPGSEPLSSGNPEVVGLKGWASALFDRDEDVRNKHEVYVREEAQSHVLFSP